jgi:hypothetical protein
MKYRVGLGVLVVGVAAAGLSVVSGTYNLIYGWIRGTYRDDDLLQVPWLARLPGWRTAYFKRRGERNP